MRIRPDPGVLIGVSFRNEVGSGFRNEFGSGFKVWSDLVVKVLSDPDPVVKVWSDPVFEMRSDPDPVVKIWLDYINIYAKRKKL